MYRLYSATLLKDPAFWLSPHFPRRQNTENPVLRSFFAPKPYGNACYAGYINLFHPYHSCSLVFCVFYIISKLLFSGFLQLGQVYTSHFCRVEFKSMNYFDRNSTSESAAAFCCTLDYYPTKSLWQSNGPKSDLEFTYLEHPDSES